MLGGGVAGGSWNKIGPILPKKMNMLSEAFSFYGVKQFLEWPYFLALIVTVFKNLQVRLAVYVFLFSGPYVSRHRVVSFDQKVYFSLDVFT